MLAEILPTERIKIRKMKEVFKNMRPFLLILLIIPIFYIFSIFRINKLIKNQKFTIGEISSEWHTKTTNKTFGIDYSYVVKNKKYVGQTKENLKISEKYLVVFDSLNPNNATLISEYGL